MAAYRRVDDLRSPAGWLPLHWDQLRAQRSVSSTGKPLPFYLIVCRAQTQNSRLTKSNQRKEEKGRSSWLETLKFYKAVRPNTKAEPDGLLDWHGFGTGNHWRSRRSGRGDVFRTHRGEHQSSGSVEDRLKSVAEGHQRRRPALSSGSRPCWRLDLGYECQQGVLWETSLHAVYSYRSAEKHDLTVAFTCVRVYLFFTYFFISPPPSRIFFVCLFVSLSVSNFVQKLLHRFARNFQGRLAMSQWTND